MAGAQRSLGATLIDWTIEPGVFRLVDFKIAVNCWSKVRMDTLSQRAESDQQARGRRVCINGLHDQVSAAELTLAIESMGYAVEVPAEIITRRWATMAYITLVSDDAVVDLILNADSCVVGNPPCRLHINVARPREAPHPNYPDDAAFEALDKQRATDHGVTHGMTDAQVAAVTKALASMQEDVLNATVQRLAGAVTGVPAELKAVIEQRLYALEQSVANMHTAVNKTSDAVAVSHEMLRGVPSQLAGLERAMATLMQRMDLLASQGEQWNDGSWGDEDWSFGDARPGSTLGADLFGTPATHGLRPSDVTPSPVQATPSPVDSARPWRPGTSPSPAPAPAVGGVDLTSARASSGAAPSPVQDPRSDAPSVAPTVPNTPTSVAMAATPCGNDVHMDGADAALEAKRVRSEVRASPPASKRVAGTPLQDRPTDEDSDMDLWDDTPPSSQPPTGGAMGELSVQTAMDNPSMVLSEGYTPITCTRLIDGWNQLAWDRPREHLDAGHSAATLLAAAILAELRFDAVINASDGPIREVYDPAEAYEALDSIRRINADSPASEKENSPPLTATITDQPGGSNANSQC
jgi:hypothetical protein